MHDRPSVLVVRSWVQPRRSHISARSWKKRNRLDSQEQEKTKKKKNLVDMHQWTRGNAGMKNFDSIRCWCRLQPIEQCYNWPRCNEVSQCAVRCTYSGAGGYAEQWKRDGIDGSQCEMILAQIHVCSTQLWPCVDIVWCWPVCCASNLKRVVVEALMKWHQDKEKEKNENLINNLMSRKWSFNRGKKQASYTMLPKSLHCWRRRGVGCVGSW